MTTVGVILLTVGVAIVWAAVRDESLRQLVEETVGGDVT